MKPCQIAALVNKIATISLYNSTASTRIILSKYLTEALEDSAEVARKEHAMLEEIKRIALKLEDGADKDDLITLVANLRN